VADNWRAEVFVPEVVLVLPDPDLSVGTNGQAGYYFIARDGIGGGTRTYTIDVGVFRTGASPGGSYETRVTVTVFNTIGPVTDFTQTLTDPGTGVYEGGGLLAIEKDGDEDEVRFTTPLGTVTAIPSTWSGNDNAQMVPATLGNRLVVRSPELSGEDSQNTVDWNNFWGSQNGTRYMGAPRSADQPGTWTGWAIVPGLGAVPPFHDTSFVQQETSFRSEQSHNEGDAFAQSLEIYEDQWAAGTTLPLMNVPAIEMARSDEHGLIWAVFTTSAHRETLYWRRSHDGGATWTEGTVSEIDGQVIRNPQIYWFSPRLVALWTDGSVVYQSFSRSLGEHWDAATPIGFTLGTLANNPRLRVVCDRRHGIAYHFARTDAGVLLLKPSFDLGDTFGDEITVHASIDDAILDAVITQDSRIHVRFKTGGGYETWTSSSWGQYWDVEATAVGLGTNPRSTEDPRSGFTFHVNWVALGTSLFGYSSPAFGNEATNFATPAGPGLVEQVADVEMRPDGVPLIAYWAPGEVFSTRRSFDFCSSWEV
jgi:hypothetical protein